MTVILAFSVFMLAIAERMPETSESIPLIGNVFLCAVLAIFDNSEDQYQTKTRNIEFSLLNDECNENHCNQPFIRIGI